jgi:hypothetical protein
MNLSIKFIQDVLCINNPDTALLILYLAAFDHSGEKSKDYLEGAQDCISYFNENTAIKKTPKIPG